jgi:hypothetical protein
LNNSEETPTAELTSIRGPEGTNEDSPFDLKESNDPTRKGAFFVANLNNIFVGQAHGHPIIDDPNKSNVPGVSEKDIVTANKSGSPVYSIDSYTGSTNPSINRVTANGKVAIGIGKLGDKKLYIGQDALKRTSGIIID